MARANDRLRIQNLGEIYNDALKVEAWLTDRTVAAEANSLLCSALFKRRDIRKEMVEELARKRGLSFEEMWDSILRDEAERMTSDELKSVQDDQTDSGVPE